MANVAVGAEENTGGISRREFLYYVWGASIALVAVQSVGLLVWFLLPRFREGEFGGKFVVPVASIPNINTPPVNFPDGRFWLVNLDTEDPNELMYQAPDESSPVIGVAAIYKVCTHLGCIYAWTAANNRFECPCHGSKYRLDGRRIESPAPRTLDRFQITFLDSNRNPIVGSESQLTMIDGTEFYAPSLIPDGALFVSVDTSAKKTGPSQTLLCSFTGNCP
jgi:cytochrome b6-f complex iron-sulfur subunit